jgi:hypothetical protein
LADRIGHIQNEWQNLKMYHSDHWDNMFKHGNDSTSVTSNHAGRSESAEFGYKFKMKDNGVE